MVGQEKVGGLTQRVKMAWPCQGLSVERPWLALGGSLLSSFEQENSPPAL